MSGRPAELQTILNEVRRRWTRRSLLRAATLGGAAAAAVILTGWGATQLLAREGIPLLVVAATVLLFATFALGCAFWNTRRKPTDRQLARLIEERDGGLDDVLVTAVEYTARPEASARMRQALLADATHAVQARNLHANLDRIISRISVRRAAFGALATAMALALVSAGFAPSAARATKVASAYLFPARLTVDVTPGSTKVRAGQPLTITARVAGLDGEVIPTLTIAVGDKTRNVRMLPGEQPGAFYLTVEKVTSSFDYNVTAANARSDNYTVTLIRPPRVERIDLHYDFPTDLGLEPRTDEDSGDIYGPQGTQVRLSIAADKPIASAFLLLDDGTKVPLTAAENALDGKLTIEENGSYRIALADRDGLENSGDTEYFIRTIDDQPPDVRIIRPASDKKVSPLEEVQIEARADDDFGVASLDVVFQTPDGKERSVPLKGVRGGLTAAGLHTLFMEDLKVQPGDFVTYYARARDVSRGRRSSEARSDIFFLEVKPFEEEFVMAQSQQMGQGGGMQSGGLEGLAEAQKQIIVATWNLDARTRRARGAQSQQDIKAVSKAQSELRDRAEQASAQSVRMTDPRSRRRGGPAPGDDPIGKAVEAMGRAVTELDKLSTSASLPHEMEALNQLLKADAENRRRQITRSQQAGGGGGQNRAEADLSSLFDQELRKRQTTNYETPNSTEVREETKQQDPLDALRELARRQDALNREQRELARNRAQMDAEELKRQLERLTREQNELRQQAQQLAQQMQNGQTGNRGSQGQQQESRRMRDVSEDMRNAATGMQRQDAEQAAQSGNRASERLRDLEREMQASRPDERRRALGDLQLESRQLADEQRRLANESSRTTKGQTGDDARRRLAADQERLADRTDRLQDNVKRMSRAGQGDTDERRATEDAARELEQQNLSSRMRQSADALRQGAAREAEQEDVAKSLERVAEQLSAASGQDANSRRQSDQLAQTQALRDKLQNIERSLEQIQREGQQGQQGQGQQSASQQSQSSSRAPQQGKGQQADGKQTGTGAGNGGGTEQLQRALNQQMRDAERLAESLSRENPGMAANPDGSWWRSFSAPGTEAFKQDFARWESLKKNLLVALEDVETKLSGELRARENEQRLNAGGHETVNDAYRDLVEKYYRSLAAPRRPQR